MLPFLRIVLIAGVAIGAVTTLFVTLRAPESSMAQSMPIERDQIRHPESDRGDPGIVVEPTVDSRGFRSGLTLEERQALREQVRGVNPDVLVDSRAMSESVAVNESYPDSGVNPVIDNSGYGGPNR